jgi:hypothetical protein
MIADIVTKGKKIKKKDLEEVYQKNEELLTVVKKFSDKRKEVMEE